MKEYVNCQHCINKRCARYGGPYGYTFCDSYIQDTPKEKTNADRIRAMSDEELAKKNVRLSYQCDIDYNWEEEPYENWMQCYETSDGSTFWVEKDAVEYELNWLHQPAGGEQHD